MRPDAVEAGSGPTVMGAIGEGAREMASFSCGGPARSGTVAVEPAQCRSLFSAQGVFGLQTDGAGSTPRTPSRTVHPTHGTGGLPWTPHSDQDCTPV